MGQSKFRRGLNRALTDYVERAQPLFDEYEKMHSGPRNNYIKERAKKLKDKIYAAKDQAIADAKSAYTGYLERLDKKAKSITGSDIDKADLALLETELYTLNQEEFDVLQDKYEGNRAMERILAGYAQKRGQGYDPKTDKSDVAKSLYCRFMSDEEKRGLAKRLYQECNSWISNDNGFAIADYVLNMAGDMFGAADKLKE